MVASLRHEPDARYRRAVQAARRGYLSVADEQDDDVRAYATFLIDMQHAHTDLECEQLCALHPDCAGVYGLMSGDETPFGASSTSSPAAKDRALIKAFAICGASHAYIAEALVYDARVIRLFESLCWDIRDKPRAWLQKYLFPDGVQATIHARDFEHLVFYMAYVHGLEGLEDFLHLRGPVTDQRAYVRRIVDRNAVDLAHKTAVSIRALEPTQKTSPEIVSASLASERLERLEMRDAAKTAAHSSDRSPERLLFEGIQSVIKNLSVANPLEHREEQAEEPIAARDFPVTFSKIVDKTSS